MSAAEGYSGVLAIEVMERLYRLELIAAGERGYSPGEITRIRDEMRRMIGMWRRLLDAHLPADDGGGGGGYCPECRSWGGWRRRRWPCEVWTEAHSRLITRYPPPPPAPAPAPPVQTPVAGWAPAPSLARPLGVHVIPTPRLPAPAATPRARVPAGHPVPCAAPTPGGAGAPGGSTRVPRHARPERTGTPKTVTSAPDDDPGADVITAPAGPGPRGGPGRGQGPPGTTQCRRGVTNADAGEEPPDHRRGTRHRRRAAHAPL